MIFTFMNKKILSLFAAVLSFQLFLTSFQPALAQGAMASQNGAQVRAGNNLADYIVAIVQREPITYAQLKAQVAFMRLNNPAQQADNAYLEQLGLQQMITYSALAQRAKEYGLRVEPEALSQAVATIANGENKTVEQLKAEYKKAGVPFSILTTNIEQQILLRQLRERLLDPTIYVNNAEINAYLAQTPKASNSSELMISLAQILIAVPEGATRSQEQALAKKAEETYQKVRQMRSIQDFISLVETYSDDPNKAQTQGALGAMPAANYPDLFIQATAGLNPGGVSRPVRSGAGYHILLVLDKEQSEMIVEQTHARHILMTVSEDFTEDQAKAALLNSKRKIENGEVAFEVLAQEQSKDGSAQNGGDLGWVVSGMFVPEFEAVMNKLQPGQISEPVTTRFGVHLIQVLERREAELTSIQQREVARERVHQRKVEEAYEQWVQGITGQTYIEMRDLPY